MIWPRSNYSKASTARCWRSTRDLPDRKVIHETIRRVINHVVSDLIRTTHDNLAKAAPRSVAEVRARSKPLVAFSPDVAREQLKLKQFLNERVYRHYKVLRMTSKARLVVTRLFDTFVNDANLMPPEHQESAHSPGARTRRPRTRPGRGRLHRRDDGPLRHPRASTVV